MKYISTVKDECLSQLEQNFTVILEKMKQEKARRYYKDKIDELKEQIRRLKDQSCNGSNEALQDQQNTLEGVMQQLRSSDC